MPPSICTKISQFAHKRQALCAERRFFLDTTAQYAILVHMNQHTSTIMETENLQQYITEAIALVGGVRKFASIAGVSERTVYAWKKGERFPNRSNIHKLCEYLESLPETQYACEKLQPTWPGLREKTMFPYESLSDESKPINEEFVFIDKAEARPSAGGGSLQTSAHPESRYAFRLDWVLQKALSSEGLRMMEVMGRSMEQTLHNGDLVLVNEHDKHLAEDRIYVIRVHDEIYVKRFARTPGRYYFRGDNRELSYQDINIDPQDESLDWEVIGKVIWAGKEL